MEASYLEEPGWVHLEVMGKFEWRPQDVLQYTPKRNHSLDRWGTRQQAVDVKSDVWWVPTA